MTHYQVRLWLETKVSKQTMPAAVIAIDKVAMPEVIDAAWYVTDFSSHIPIIRFGPLTIVFFLRFVEMMKLRFFVELTIHGMQHRPVTATDNHSII